MTAGASETAGAWIRRLRQELGLTQEEFAQRLGVSGLTVSRWERNAGRPSTLSQRQLEQLEASRTAAAAQVERLAEEVGPPAGNLPLPLTSFVGRTRELAELRRLLATTRLLTLTGPGGCGKTRLALEAVAHGVSRVGGRGADGAVSGSNPNPIMTRTPARREAEHSDRQSGREADSDPRQPTLDARHGVWMVDLAAITDPGLVVQAVAGVLDVPEESDRPLRDALLDALRPRRLVLVLDNCEHLLAACAELASALLSGCAGIRILATSREPLGVPGEHVWPVPPLSLAAGGDRGESGGPIRFEAGLIGSPQSPSETSALSPQSFGEAVELFLERVWLTQADFRLTPENAGAITELCRRLDGLPLALELAAAWLRVLTPEQLVARLQDRLSLLVGERSALPRHRTMRAAIAWSYDLLRPQEQALFRRLAVFSGSFSLEAAEVIGDREQGTGDRPTGSAPGEGQGSGRQAPPQARVRPAGSAPGEEQGTGNAPQSSALPPASGGSVRPEAGPFGSPQFSSESSEVLAVLRRLVEASLVLPDESDGEPGYRILETLREYGRERLLEGGEAEFALRRHAEYYAGFVERAEPELRGRGQARWLRRLLREYDNVRAALTWATGESGAPDLALRIVGALWHFWEMRSLLSEGHIWLERAVARGGAPLARAGALSSAGLVAYRRGDHATARAWFQECLDLRQEFGDLGGLLQPLSGLGLVALEDGDTATARMHFEEALRIARGLGNERTCATILSNLGIVARLSGNDAEADAFFAESLPLARRSGDAMQVAITCENWAHLARHLGEFTTALERHRESLMLFQSVGSTQGAAGALAGLGSLAGDARHWPTAVRLIAAARTLVGQVGGVLPSYYQAEYDETLERAREALGAEAFAAQWKAGSDLSLNEAIREAGGAEPRQSTDARIPVPPGPPATGGAVAVAAPPRPGRRLSPRELEVLQLIAEGRGNKEIARLLGVSLRTVEHHITAIYARLGFHSKAEATAYYLGTGEEGVIRDP
jgi:predicted ATPase/DNA-binding CsgD family transcriptional regulator/DNA-binding XRE family transcriptional regulator